MLRTLRYIFSLLTFLAYNLIQVQAQDTIPVPLKIRAGLELSGTVSYFTDKNILNEEAYVSVDLDEKKSVFFAAGFLNFKYSQYNYSYLNKGSFIRAGIDFNLLKPEKSKGKYWAGVGFRYGISRFTAEFPSFQKENYWGTVSSSIPSRTSWAHFLEASPGIRAELFRNFSIGWNVGKFYHKIGSYLVRLFPGSPG